MSAPSEPKHESADMPNAQAGSGPESAANPGSDTEASRIEIDEETLLSPDAVLEGPQGADEAPDEVESLKQEVATTKDRWLRAVADLENFKKRSKRETQDAVQREVQKLLNDFLPVADNLNRALEAVNDKDERIGEGISMVKQVFMSALDKNGIVPVAGVGAPFDPAIHDAMQQVPSQDHPPGRVVMVFETGFTRHGRLLRPAKVIVSDESSTGTAPEGESQPDTPADA